jgi:hypothetical protein
MNLKIKAIAGIENRDLDAVMTVVRAAVAAQVAAVDVCADADVLGPVLAEVGDRVAVFASSVNPDTLLAAEAMGAKWLELGNYDGVYERGAFITAEDVLSLTQAVVERTTGTARLCVTVPGHLHRDVQVRLAQQLEALGVAMLQTEGASRQLGAEATAPHTAEDKFAISLENTRALAAAVSIPVMTATGVTPDNASLALRAGAAWVGVGRAISQLATEDEMVDALRLMTLPVQQVAIA